MSRAAQPVVVFFAFANDRAVPGRYLRNLPEEQRHVRGAMAAAEEAGLCEVVERANATVDEVPRRRCFVPGSPIRARTYNPDASARRVRNRVKRGRPSRASS